MRWWLASMLATISPTLDATDAILIAHSPSDQSAGPSRETHVLSSRTFNIPFSVRGGSPDVRVELMVCRRGKPSKSAIEPIRWDVASTRSSDIDEPFVFTANDDGEYWFATRMIAHGESKGSAEPTVDDAKVLKVFVDTRPPKIHTIADADGDGTVRADISVHDATSTDKVEVRYITDRQTAWNNLEFPESGALQFQPSGDWDQIAIDVEATDAAGNRNRDRRFVHRPRVAAMPSDRLAAAPNHRYDAPPSLGFAAPITSGSATDTSRAGRGRPNQSSNRIALPSPATPEQIGLGFASPDPGLSAGGASAPADNGLPSSSQADETDASVRHSRSPDTPATLNEAIRSMSAPSVVDRFESASESETIPAPRGVKEPSSRPTPKSSEAGSPIDSTTTQRFRADRPSLAERDLDAPVRYSDRRQFSLEYELEAIDAHGVEAIELYGTLDGGLSWKLWGRDPDRQSPFDIEVRESGAFGYRIVVVGQSGMASPRPLAGEPADIVVVVDQEPPELRVTGVKYGVGDEAGSLIVEYRCEDPNLKSRPISMSFGPSTDGPWTTIAGGLRNNGRYAWPAGPDLPRQFYLRVDAADQAGNVRTDILDRPVDAHGLAPRARIRGFRTGPGT